MRFELTVTTIERGQIAGINDHKAVIEAKDDEAGHALEYWTTVDEAPRIGAKLVVTIGGVE